MFRRTPGARWHRHNWELRGIEQRRAYETGHERPSEVRSLLLYGCRDCMAVRTKSVDGAWEMDDFVSHTRALEGTRNPHQEVEKP